MRTLELLDTPQFVICCLVLGKHSWLIPTLHIPVSNDVQLSTYTIIMKSVSIPPIHAVGRCHHCQGGADHRPCLVWIHLLLQKVGFSVSIRFMLHQLIETIQGLIQSCGLSMDSNKL